MTGSFQNEIPAARINLKLDVGKGNAKKRVELPLKMLVMGDFTLRERSERIAEREKTAVNKNNFEQVMSNLGLRLSYTVENRLSGEGEIPIELDIRSMDSFKPETIAKSVPALSRLLAARNLLKDLKSNLLDNREFRKRLEEMIRDPRSAENLRTELRAMVPELEDKTQ
ncbi:MAG: type VI secretion system contractile sheath small subunit [Chitinispirillaceae bacterium]